MRRADVTRTGRTPAAHRDMKPPRPSSFGEAATAWGVEVAGGWDRLTWGPGGRYWYRYPVMASITRTGPGRTPATEFMVTADPGRHGHHRRLGPAERQPLPHVKGHDLPIRKGPKRRLGVRWVPGYRVWLLRFRQGLSRAGQGGLTSQL